MPNTITVSADLSANPDFTTITAALESIDNSDTSSVTIHILPGIYKEKLAIERPNVTFLGDDAETTIITYDDYARFIMEDGIKRGTFRTSTVFVGADHFIAKNITFENSSGLGINVGQALALYADGDMLLFDNCRFLGSQDTIFTGPLPPSPYEPGSFAGPREHAPRINGRQHYRNCFIRGDVDFIFGSATAYFEKCTIFSQKTDDEPAAATADEQKCYGFITAASTAEGQKYGYVFDRCRLISNCPPESVYLGRPWRHYAKTVFINCIMGNHIKRAGWHDWNKADAHDTIFYAEYKSMDENGKLLPTDERASFARQLSDNEVAEYTYDKIFFS